MHFNFQRKAKETTKTLSPNRKEWLQRLLAATTPVLDAAAAGTLKQHLPEKGEALEISCLAAAANVLVGLSSYLEASPPGEEKAVHSQLLSGARTLLDAIVAPDSPDYCPGFTGSCEPNARLAQTGMLAFALIKAKNALLHCGDADARQRLLAYFQQAKYIRPQRNSRELLFSAMIELVLFELTGNCETQNLDYTMTTVTDCFSGDGTYKNKGAYHWSYENSYALYPLLEVLMPYLPQWFEWRVKGWSKVVEPAFARYTTIQARFLAPDGTYPVLGYGMCMRTGAFHTLAHAALRKKLPPSLSYAETCAALSGAMRRTLDPEGTFGAGGFLQKGLCGYQPSLCEPDFTTGQLYSCLAVFAPLGLPQNHVFWGVPKEKSPWQKAWTGENIPLDQCH